MRHSVNEFWVNLCKSIQLCCDAGDFRGMYQGIKCAMRPSGRKKVAIKDIFGNPITEKHKQLERWAQHYSTLYSKEVSIRPETLQCIPKFPIATELDEVPLFDDVYFLMDSNLAKVQAMITCLLNC
ncbi:unnamed protein product [Diatraea saccharalis]|uniref:Uncharacterized protein n=1 Tax=Diatraea saccharalis TaxID=40085 RepID=A0A9N9WE21_9NEOP|nr:unnamed protein product [Diatraea saccharalis]